MRKGDKSKSFKSIKFQKISRNLSGVSEEEEDPTIIRNTTNVAEEPDY